MTEEPGRIRLGRGLAALLGDAADEPAAIDRARGNRRAPIEFLRPNPRNPRKYFDSRELEELAKSIKLKGLIQPVVVRSINGSTTQYEIIAGERRWRAAQQAGRVEIPIVQIDASDKEALELAIIENVQRAELNPLEEASGYKQLIEQFNYSQQDLSGIIGKSRSHIANIMRILALPDDVKAQIHEGKLTAGHARALLGVSDPSAAARDIVAKGLTVRDIERLAQEARPPGTARPKREKDADTRALEYALTEATGFAVSINHQNSGGTVSIRYASLDQLELICARLKGN